MKLKGAGNDVPSFLVSYMFSFSFHFSQTSIKPNRMERKTRTLTEGKAHRRQERLLPWASVRPRHGVLPVGPLPSDSVGSLAHQQLSTT